MIFDRYKKNLKLENNFVYSYNTKVAEIIDDNLIVNNYYSVTTSKHVNHVAKKLNLNLIKNYE